jgi:predicted  nucleic acid-binding Zn-ribbon protein
MTAGEPVYRRLRRATDETAELLMSGFEALLRLQDQDIKLDQLDHKLATLPEREALDALGAALAGLERDTAPAQVGRDEIAREQKQVEHEVSLVEAKAAEVHHKLYDTGITSPKELQALQADHDSLKRRQTQLEDRVLELMEAAEPVDAQLSGLDERRRALEAEREATTAALAAASAAVEADLVEARSVRAELAAAVAPDQLATYDRLRPQFQGIAVARLVGTQCGGCHLSLSAMALEAVRRLPPGGVAHCEECGRILVP